MSREYDVVKGSTIIFIIIVVVTNGFLITRNVRKTDFILEPKALTIITMAFADVMCALFTKAVKAKLYFGNANFSSPKDVCPTKYIADVYYVYVDTFVYGIWLIILGLEIIHHSRISKLTKQSKIVCSIFASGSPWVLSLSIILPLGLANVDMDTCEDKSPLDQKKALFFISGILPAFGSLLTSVITIFYVKCRVNISNQLETRESLQNKAYPSIQNPTYNSKAMTYNQEIFPTEPESQCLQPLMNAGLEDSTQSDFGHTQRRQRDSQPTNFQSDISSLAIHTRSADQSETPDVKSLAVTSGQRLLVISLVYFVSSVPWTVLKLLDLMEWNDEDIENDIWLAVRAIYLLREMRFVVTPILMYYYSDN